MPAESPRIVEPSKLAKVARMELIARHAVEGFVTGRHPSPFHGSSVEYADHRPYTVNDEIRTVDWKLLAKTDKYYIKLFEEETNCRVSILIDASRSMGFGVGGGEGSGANNVTKFEYACYLAAALSYLMIGQNDAVGLALFDSTVREYLPPRTTATHFRRILETMLTNTARSDTSIGKVLHELAGRSKRRGIVIVLSDLLDNVDETIDGLAHFRFDRHEVLVFHLMDPAELTFPYERLTRFKDIEGAGHLIANPRYVREKYLKRLNEFLAEVRRKCLERGIGYKFVETNTPYDQMLMAYLEQRMKLK